MTSHWINEIGFGIVTWLIFFASVFVIFYTFVGYPLCLLIRALLSSRKVHSGEYYPSVCIIIAIHNQVEVIHRKVVNVLALEYPAEKLRVVVASDGSTDGTNARLKSIADSRVDIVEIPERKGKANALNQALKITSSEIVLFTDARQMLEPESLKVLISNFADPQVGCVSGELMLKQTNGSVGALGIYWKIEKAIRKLESASGSVIGVTGAIYAARRGLLRELPAETILDDVLIPMSLSRQGYRVVFEPRARAWDALSEHPEREFRRKVRTLTGNYQLLLLAPWLVTPDNPLLWRFFSHKLTRLIVPFALGSALVSNLFLAGPFFRAALILQLAFYFLGVLGWIPFRLGHLNRITDSIRAFLMLNGAAISAFVNFLRRNWEVWV